MAGRRPDLRSPAFLAWVATILIVVSVVSMVTLKVLPECWRDNPTWSAGQCIDDYVRRGGPFAPPRPPVPKPVVPPAPQLTLNWVDNSAGEGGFRIERKTGAGGAYAMLVEVPSGTTTYVDASVATGTTYCYRVKAFSEAGESGYSNENCGTVASAFGVAVNVTGSGTVTSTPGGINCGPACSVSFPVGTVVTLAAAPASGSQFTGWAGGGCTGTADCSLTGSGAVAVTATFGAASAPGSLTLTVTGNPATGPYNVQAVPSSSGDVRVEFWVDGALARAENGAPYYLFGDTGGVPAMSTLGAGSHAVVGKVYAQTGSTVLAEAAITITEVAPPPATFNLAVNRSGEGTVVSAPAGISCGADCAEAYAGGTAVTLSALPSSGWTFSSWSGGGCSSTAPCTVTLTAASTVTATFTQTTTAAPPPPPPPPPSPPAPPPPPATYSLSVSKSGQGTVSSAPGGINCGSDCSQSYPTGTVVTLTADPNSGWKFTGWTGGGCSGTASCTVTVTAARSVSASFARDRAKR